MTDWAQVMISQCLSSLWLEHSQRHDDSGVLTTGKHIGQHPYFAPAEEGVENQKNPLSFEPKKAGGKDVRHCSSSSSFSEPRFLILTLTSFQAWDDILIKCHSSHLTFLTETL